MSSYFLQGKCFRPILVLVLTLHHRPESIGEGFHRLYLSNDFKTADADLTERINQVTRELEAIALELDMSVIARGRVSMNLANQFALGGTHILGMSPLHNLRVTMQHRTMQQVHHLPRP
jgi:hypothetical protein